MRSKIILAAGALAVSTTLAGATGLAGGAADAAHQTRHPGAVRAAALQITVTSTKGSTTLSQTQFTPGNTVFDIEGKGGLEIVSFRSGFTVKNLAKDAKKLFSGDVKVVREVDKKVVFWGGAQGEAGGARVGINLPAGSYYAVNLDRSHVAPFTVAGTPESRELPSSGGTVKMIHDMTFDAPDRLPNKGWITLNNKATEPHFVDFSKVKPGTTRQQIKSFLMNGAHGQPSWGLPEFHEALIVSPGHSFVYDMRATKGEYVELCFWPSKRTGMPHALMGMYDVSQLS